MEVLEQARKLTANEDALKAITYLEQLYKLLVSLGYEKYITFDLGMLSKHAYYTGVIFNAYTYGTGDSIVKGGRYDKLIGQFGSEKASIGFSLTLDQLMAAMERQKIHIPVDDSGVIVLYDAKSKPDAFALAKKLRNTGCAVNMISAGTADFEEYLQFARLSNIRKIVRFENNEYSLTDVSTGNVSKEELI